MLGEDTHQVVLSNSQWKIQKDTKAQELIDYLLGIGGSLDIEMR
jgi:hypothetical protein